jgi:hypothetical protein
VAAGIQEDGDCGPVRQAATNDALPEQPDVRGDAQRHRRDGCGARNPFGVACAELVELVDQAGEDRAGECTGAAHDDAAGRIRPDERSTRGPADQDRAVRCRAIDGVVLVRHVDRLAAVQVEIQVEARVGRDDDRRRPGIVRLAAHRHSGEHADTRGRDQDRHTARRHDQRSGEDEDRYHDGRAPCSTRFHASITARARDRRRSSVRTVENRPTVPSLWRDGGRGHCSRKNCSPTSTRAPRSTR